MEISSFTLLLFPFLEYFNFIFQLFRIFSNFCNLIIIYWDPEYEKLLTRTRWMIILNLKTLSWTVYYYALKPYFHFDSTNLLIHNKLLICNLLNCSTLTCYYIFIHQNFQKKYSMSVYWKKGHHIQKQIKIEKINKID